MSEPSPNPLLDLHTQGGAEFQNWADVQIVSTFGETAAEYAAIRKAAALVDEPQRGILEFSGKDRHSFLNNLLTNETWNKTTKSGLATGTGVYAYFLNQKGRIVADMNVLERGESLYLETDVRLVEGLRAAFDKYVFREDLKISSRVGILHQLALHGPGAGALLASIADTDVAALPQLGSVPAQLFDVPLTIWRDDAAAAMGFHLVMETGAARKVWVEMVSRFFDACPPGRRLLRPAGWAAFNATRIEGGRPVFGIDFDDSTLPAEAGQFARAISLTKGCYLGQEIVARMYARGQAARQLVGIRMDDTSLPISGAMIYDDQSNQVGGVTSSTMSPVLSNAAIGLALMKKNFASPGTVIHIPAEGAVRPAKVVELPFLK